MTAPKPNAILFVCMGNICRSPTAEGVFRGKAQEAGLLDQLLIDSSGTHAYHVGEPPDLRSQEFARKRDNARKDHTRAKWQKKSRRLLRWTRKRSRTKAAAGCASRPTTRRSM